MGRESHKLFWIVSLLSCISVAVAQPAPSCAPKPLSEAEAEQLVRLVPPALYITRIGGELSLHQDTIPPNLPHRELFYSFMVVTDASNVTLLDNGLVGYYDVNKVTGQVFNVVDEEVFDPQLAVLQKQLRKQHCVSSHRTELGSHPAVSV